MWRVAIDISELNRNKSGTSTYVGQIYKHCANLNCKDFQFIFFQAKYTKSKDNKILKLLNVFIELYWYLIKLPLLVNKMKIDLLHIPANGYAPLAKCKQIATILDTTPIKFPQEYNVLWKTMSLGLLRMAGYRADRILTLSQAAKRDIEYSFNIPSRKITYIYPGPGKIRTIEDKHQSPYTFPYILYVGEIQPHKNLPRLLKAFKEIIKHPKLNEYHLVITGLPKRGSREVMESIHGLGLEDFIHVLGYVDEEHLEILYMNSSLFVFPSLNEGFGFPALEAISYGIPVVASNSSCLPEILNGGAEYFDPYDITSIANTISKVLIDLKNSILRTEVGKTVLAKYSWKQSINELLNIYREVLTPRD